jgi:hypothetical protein
MRWRKEPAHQLVALKDVRKLTGLDPEELLRRQDTQRLVRINKRGGREELLRIPIALLEGKDSD